MSLFNEPYDSETFVEHILNYVGGVVFVILPVFLLGWLPLRIVGGGIQWLLTGTVETISLCTITTSRNLRNCSSDTGAIGFDKIVNWFIQTEITYILVALAGILIVLGLRFWKILLYRMEEKKAVKRMRQLRKSSAQD